MINAFQAHFPHLEFIQEYALGQISPVRIGGPAELFVSITQEEDFISLITYCQRQDIPFTIIGWLANTLISDRGVRGLVIENKVQYHHIRGTITPKALSDSFDKSSRWHSTTPVPTQDVNNTIEYVEVEISAGMSLPAAINILIMQGIGGLHWFSRIPASIGGAIYNNIHGGSHLLSEYIVSVKILDESGAIRIVPAEKCDFEYDYSLFHQTNDCILSATFALPKGNHKDLQQQAIDWAKHKAHQPSRSLGCVFQNLSSQQQADLKLPTTSIGYLIEQVLGLKEYRVGDAQISKYHCAFIENVGAATAKDYLAIVEHIHTQAKKELGISLQPEIFFKGFTSKELAFLAKSR